VQFYQLQLRIIYIQNVFRLRRLLEHLRNKI
jgi:hypothetical protein